MAGDYLAGAFSELLEEDGLTVFGRGMGIRALLSKFIRLYNDAEKWGTRLVFCLNVVGDEQAVFNVLLDDGCPRAQLPVVVTNETPPKDRQQLYAKGGVYLITSRILVVDMLNGVVDPAQIHGFLVHQAHRVTETSSEGFILRIFRQANRSGFVKAFSEDPEHLSRGFSKAQKVLQACFLRRLYLWPRFRAEVIRSLNAGTP
eukprot:CAMPEP_0118967860 /NCGR_PEP_ID=MMETSP1173-20130426/5182_1 /TAXON_ID=1034831 /ORGANISM="Rhizochromulina marina cf, Strain CCMP1243" /LENGTH=201 /DNA_ID=CAMNT_0006916893 /DNA_START=54 /DNA_END=656 /DNA_ORIENTATION=-